MAIEKKTGDRVIKETFTSAWAVHSARVRREKWQQFYELIRGKVSVYHINDCADDDARLRLQARTSEIVGRNESFAGASSDLEAAGLLVDLFDALDGASNTQTREHKNVALVNVAPRNGDAKKKHENGTPFGYFRHNGTLVVSTVDGLTFSLLKKLGITGFYRELDTRATLRRFREKGQIGHDEERRVGETQFRSYEFSPRVASYVLREGELPGEEKRIEDTADAPQAVWFVDKFGNLKTTLLPEEVFSDEVVKALKPKEGKTETAQVAILATAFGELPVYRRLKDVPDKILAVIVGSSGLEDKRFLEIVVQGGNASKEAHAGVGTVVYGTEGLKKD